MKMRYLAVAATAAFVSFGAVAGGQQQPQSKESTVPQAAEEISIVREAQEKLRSQGYAATPQGLAEFQQAEGIEPSGKLDQQTLAALGIDPSAASGGSSSERAAEPSDSSSPQR